MTVQGPRILIADDHALMRDGMSLMVKKTWPAAICEMASDYGQVLSLLGSSFSLVSSTPQFEVVVLDLRMPGMRGAESVALICERARGARIIVCTALDDPSLPDRLMTSGVFSVVNKTNGADELLKHIEAALQMNESAAGKLAGNQVAPISQIEHSSQSGSSLLTHRQRQILALLRAGKPSKVIGSELGISVETVKSHLREVYAQLKVSNRSEAIIKSQDWLL